MIQIRPVQVPDLNLILWGSDPQFTKKMSNHAIYVYASAMTSAVLFPQGARKLHTLDLSENCIASEVHAHANMLLSFGVPHR